MASVPPSPRPRWLEWLPVVSALAIVVGGFMSMGGYINDLRRAQQDIVALKAAQDRDRDAVNAKLEQIVMTTTRTDATLQALRGANGELRP